MPSIKYVISFFSIFDPSGVVYRQPEALFTDFVYESMINLFAKMVSFDNFPLFFNIIVIRFDFAHAAYLAHYPSQGPDELVV